MTDVNFLKLARAEPGMSPVEAQTSRRKRFWAMVESCPLRRFTPGEQTSTSPLHLRVGLAPAYSDTDLLVADTLVQIASKNTQSDIAIFDVMELNAMPDLKAYLPGIEEAFQTPIVGIWRNGKFEGSTWGVKDRRLLHAYA